MTNPVKTGDVITARITVDIKVSKPLIVSQQKDLAAKLGIITEATLHAHPELPASVITVTNTDILK